MSLFRTHTRVLLPVALLFLRMQTVSLVIAPVEVALPSGGHSALAAVTAVDAAAFVHMAA